MRQYEQELEIAASPDEVWRALAEAEGIKSWFAPEVRVTPGKGGSKWASWGPGMEGESKIEVWEPGRAVRYAHDRASGGQNIVDFRIETKDGGQTTLRLVNSGFGSDASFDNEVESTWHAWPLFLLLLKLGVERRYTRCVNVTVFKTIDLPQAEAWRKFNDGPAVEGEIRHFDPYGNGCWETPGGLTAVFCEKCGGQSTMLTIMCLLYDPVDGADTAAREMAERLAARAA